MSRYDLPKSGSSEWLGRILVAAFFIAILVVLWGVSEYIDMKEELDWACQQRKIEARVVEPDC